jgi:hypothetical protein
MTLTPTPNFQALIALPEYGGRYVSITPGHPAEITPGRYAELVAKHIMFKDMSADAYLLSAGIADHWPEGRGCYISGQKDAKLAQKLGHLQPFLAVFPQECMGQLASSGPT